MFQCGKPTRGARSFLASGITRIRRGCGWNLYPLWAHWARFRSPTKARLTDSRRIAICPNPFSVIAINGYGEQDSKSYIARHSCHIWQFNGYLGDLTSALQVDHPNAKFIVSRKRSFQALHYSRLLVGHESGGPARKATASTSVPW